VLTTQNNEHNKIIRNAAREILAPLGVFQKGQSRIWIDDNGWFLTIIEFQPSGWSKGAYLNASMHFLWSKQEGISFDFSFDIGARVHSHIEHADNGSEFYSEMIKLSKIAEEEVKKYREFKDPYSAIEIILQKKFHCENLWGNWHKAMLCFICDDFSCGKQYMEQFSKIHTVNEEINQFIKEQAELFLTDVHSADDLKNIILLTIREQRQFYRNHGMKDLKIHTLYG
jgi:hypothetical protein